MAGNRELKLMADKLRVHSIRSTSAAGSGHPTSCMSCAEIMSTLFFSEMKEDDEFVLSKGHAAPILWAAYAEAGIVSRKELMNLRKIDSVLEGHPTNRMKCIKIATGSLGQGLSAGVGMALAKRLKDDRGMVYVLMGDGETAEGSVWEAANSAAYLNADNLCAIIDLNRLGQSGQAMHGHEASIYKKKFHAFGWDTAVIDGHDIKELRKAIRLAKKGKKPYVIIAKTIKGKGVSFLENKNGLHGKPVKDDRLDKALKEIGAADITLKSSISCCRKQKYSVKPAAGNRYSKGEMVATRTAFGKALVNMGRKNKNIVVLDGDVKNSTRTKFFFEEFPKRSFQSFIAEQNMVGMALGFSVIGFVSVAATFACFLTRAHDFIRMAQYSQGGLNLVGSHTGVSIGEDGPSQMGLEDISMFMSMPESVILNPCDAVSAESLTTEMLKRQGINYLRTMRQKTPVIYKNKENFRIGGLKVLRKSSEDTAMVIGTGTTVHEALKAYDELKDKGINIRVIDLYSIKPVDEKALLKHAKECNNNVLVAEDHYKGGAGCAVSEVLGKIRHLYIRDIPRSGKPEKLIRKYKIDSKAIIRDIKQIR